MGKIVEKKKKKKGRPSLLDLQKRNLKQQQDLQTQKPKFNPNPNSHFSNPNRRFNLRNSDEIGTGDNNNEEEEEDEVEEDDSNEKRKEKKLKLVLRLPSQNQIPPSVTSTSLNSGSYVSDSNADDENGETETKKRKINVGGYRSGVGDGVKEEKQDFASKMRDAISVGEIAPTTPLPDTKLMIFILDRLQKKDTYGVYSEPVDPKELPDYHEIIEHPMDFGTVRNNLLSGAYANLEQFEKDVFLICSNAMRYNASDTIYFRQARSIQELAKRDFDNLRQESDDNEPRPKVVRRGRPPTKNLKKNLGGPTLERAGSEFSSDATLATGGDGGVLSNSYDLRKGLHSEKSGSADALRRTSLRPRQGGAYGSWMAEHKYEGNDDFPASVLKGTKFGKKHFIIDENRRNTYTQSLSSVCGREGSVLTTFDGERKQLMAVGLHMEYSFARSLARFAETLGPIAWKIASKKIERALPAGMKFGPGWVGEHEKKENPSSKQSQPTPSTAQPPLPQQPSSISTPSMVDPEADKREPLDSSPSTVVSSPPSLVAKDPGGSAQGGGLSTSDSGAATRPYPPPFQHHQTLMLKNGISGAFGYNLASQSQTGKPVRPAGPVGAFSSDSVILPATSRSNNSLAQSMPVDNSELEETKSTLEADTDHESETGAQMPQPSTSGQEKVGSVPPDLNVRFQSPGSPNPNPKAQPQPQPAPDLVLQL